MNIIDKAIAFFDPAAGLKRAYSRSMIGAFEAGGRGRRTKAFNDRGGSAANDTSQIFTIRNRSRDLVRNNPFAARAVEVIATNVVGTGVVPTFSGTTSANVSKVSKAWKEWAQTTACDFEGMHNFYALQELVMRSVAESGEVFIRRRISDAKDAVPFKLQVLESEFCDFQKDGISDQNGGYTIQGIEFDKDGKRVAYWLFERHPDDNIQFRATESKRVPADEIEHVFKKVRPGQVRGIPKGVQAFLRLKDFDGYEDAQLVRQKMAACQVAAVYKTEIPESPTGLVKGEDSDDQYDRMEPGQYQYLNPGEQIVFSNPPGVENYDEYSRKILQGVASAYGITYEALTNDYSNVNFSSGRMGWIEMHRNISSWQWNVLIPMFCEKTMNWFFRFGGLLQAGFKPTMVEWTAPRREMIDPVKETKALSDQVRNGFKSWTEAALENGYDPEILIKQIADDQKKRDELGLQLACDIRFDAGKSNDEEPTEPEETIKNTQNKK